MSMRRAFISSMTSPPVVPRLVERRDGSIDEPTTPPYAVAMLIAAAMKQPAWTVQETDSVVASARRMRDASVAFLPVCDRGGQLVGAITEHGIVRRFVADDLAPSTRVSEIMDRCVFTCRARDDLFEAQKIMREHHVRRLVCLDEKGYPVGVLTLSDVAQYEDGFRLAKTTRGATQPPRATGTG